MMPTPDGRDVYEFIRKHKADHLGRLLFMTGGAFTPRLKRFCEEIEGLVPVLQKPFGPVEFRDAVKKLTP